MRFILSITAFVGSKPPRMIANGYSGGSAMGNSVEQTGRFRWSISSTIMILCVYHVLITATADRCRLTDLGHIHMTS